MIITKKQEKILENWRYQRYFSPTHADFSFRKKDVSTPEIGAPLLDVHEESLGEIVVGLEETVGIQVFHT